jgi:hypothetical protein
LNGRSRISSFDRLQPLKYSLEDPQQYSLLHTNSKTKAKSSDALLLDVTRHSDPSSTSPESPAMRPVLLRSFSAGIHLGPQQARAIGSSSARQWDEVRHQRHPGEHRNPMLRLPKTVSVIGAPMTCTLRSAGCQYGVVAED